MKKTLKVMMIAAVMILGAAAFAGPHGRPVVKKHGHNPVAQIIHTIKKAVHGQPRYRRPAPPPRFRRPAPMPKPHRRPAPPRHHRR